MSWDNLETGTAGQVYDIHKGEWRDPPPLATSIPAAIKRAEEHVASDEHESGNCDCHYPGKRITATEVALAKALWEQMRGDEYRRHPANSEAVPPPALIAFTEKVESLDG